MESSQQARRSNNEEATKHEGLPMKSSPYLKYDDLEEYKRNAYGTEGHQEVKPQGGGATTGPTLSGSASASDEVTLIGVATAIPNLMP